MITPGQHIDNNNNNTRLAQMEKEGILLMTPLKRPYLKKKNCDRYKPQNVHVAQ